MSNLQKIKPLQTEPSLLPKKNGDDEMNRKDKKFLGFWEWWLFSKEGTIAEPWSTAEDLLPTVQHEQKMIGKILKK